MKYNLSINQKACIENKVTLRQAILLDYFLHFSAYAKNYNGWFWVAHANVSANIPMLSGKVDKEPSKTVILSIVNECVAGGWLMRKTIENKSCYKLSEKYLEIFAWLNLTIEEVKEKKETKKPLSYNKEEIVGVEGLAPQMKWLLAHHMYEHGFKLKIGEEEKFATWFTLVFKDFYLPTSSGQQKFNGDGFKLKIPELFEWYEGKGREIKNVKSTMANWFTKKFK